MAKKEIVKVPLSKERLELAMGYMGYSMTTLAKISGISATTLRRAAKAGSINREYALKIAEQLATTLHFLSGDKAMNAVARAIKAANEFYASAPEQLKAEIAAIDAPVEEEV